jgi:hypothetical protein
MWDSPPRPFVTKSGRKFPNREKKSQKGTKSLFGNKCSFFHSGGLGKEKTAKSRRCVSLRRRYDAEKALPSPQWLFDY